MALALQIIVGAWLAWCALCLGSMLLVPLIAPSHTASTNGLVIVVPFEVRKKLTAAELEAIVAHERGHRARLHVVKNLLRACCFMKHTPERAAAQEIEADDYAAERTDPAMLASALRKLSSHPFDLYRAERLDCIAARKAG